MMANFVACAVFVLSLGFLAFAIYLWRKTRPEAVDELRK